MFGNLTIFSNVLECPKQQKNKSDLENTRSIQKYVLNIVTVSGDGVKIFVILRYILIF